MNRFNGFPPEALDFYERLEADNSKTFWTANKAVYEEACRAPMEALLTALEKDFGPWKIFRPYRDVRFSRDKSPYKLMCAGHNDGGYFSLSADGLYVGGGAYMLDGPDLQRYRAAVAADASGGELQRIVATLRRKGFEPGGEALKGAPKGFSTDHPRIDLLRHKGLHAGRMFTPEPWLHTKAALTRVKGALKDLGPLHSWLSVNVWR